MFVLVQMILSQGAAYVFIVGGGLALRCVRQQRGESSGQESDGGCGCPTGQSVPSKCPPPQGWGETWRIPQTLRETEEREKSWKQKKNETDAGVVMGQSLGL